MGNSKGFVFSLDSFVAFTLCLVMIYSLIFFSSIPSGYYSTLAQAHLIAKDTLNTLVLTKCSFPECNDKSVNVLEHVVFRSSQKEYAVQNFIGAKIPLQFGYKFEIFKNGNTKEYEYDTRNAANDQHKKSVSKLSVSTDMIVFSYKTKDSDPSNPNKYITCGGERTNLCSDIASNYNSPEFEIRTVKLTVYI